MYLNNFTQTNDLIISIYINYRIIISHNTRYEKNDTLARSWHFCKLIRTVWISERGLSSFNESISQTKILGEIKSVKKYLW